MITLEDLKPNKGAVKKVVRVGRGRSSGCGKTSSRGNNGEGQRSGRSSKRGFEGGQMPSYRQMPKLKGFKNRFALQTAEINVCDLNEFEGDSVDLLTLIQNKKAHPSCVVLRVLGNGELKKAITVKATYVTASAKEKIEKAGGKVELV